MLKDTRRERPGGTHLTGGSQYCSLDLFLMRGKHQPVHHVLTNGGQDDCISNPMHSSMKSPEKCLDAHLQRLWQNRKGKVMNGGLHLVPRLSTVR